MKTSASSLRLSRHATRAWNQAGLGIAAALTFAVPRTVSSAVVVSDWANAVSGAWNVDANWINTPAMGGFPNNGNGGVATYDAVINATGTNYTVTLGTSVTVEDLLISSANATLNHTAGTFTATGAIGISAGTYQLNGGTISNTTINVTGTGSLVIGTNPNNLLTGVTVNGDLNLAATNAVTRIGPGTSFATAHMANQSAEIGFLAGATLNGTILLEGAGGGTRFIGMSTAGSVTIGATGVIRTNTGLGGDAQLGIGNNFFAAMGLTNNGLISSQVSGRTLTINPATSFANSGNLEALNGGILTITTTGWTNTGTIAVGPGSVVNLGPLNATGGIGTFNNTGGTVNISGTINNTGGTILLNSTTGSWTLAGGAISGGTVNFADGTSLLVNANTNNLLTGVTVNGDVNLSAINAVTRIGPGTTITTAHLANQSTEIGFLAGATMNGTILLEGASANTRFIGMSTAGTVTIGATGVIRSNTGFGGIAQIGVGNNFFAAMALTNNGLISSQVSGRTITINAATSFANSGTGKLEALNGGILTITTAGWTNTGTVAVGPGSVVNLGPLNATAGIGTCAAVFGNSAGIIAGNSCAISDCVAYVNQGDGFTVGQGCTLRHCSSFNNANGGDGFEVGQGTGVVDCRSYGNQGNGILGTLFSTTVIVSGCTVHNNLKSGISTGGGIVTRCDSSGNTNDGIRVNGSCRITENRCDSNGTSATMGAGIHVIQSECFIENNSVAFNQIGIDVDSSPNMITGNSARASVSANYSVIAGNMLGTILTSVSAMNAATNNYGNLSF